MQKNSFLSKAIIMLLTLCLFSICTYGSDLINEGEEVPCPPFISVNAKSACLIDAYSGELLFTQNADTRCFPASTTKILTCYLSLKYGNQNDYVTITEDAWTGVSQSASNANLQVGETLSVYELMQCLMIVSANEAANALAIYVSGSIDAFVELMNEEAINLGCENSHFVNPNGLHDEAHYTTAKDMAKIARAAVAYEAFRVICSSSSATIRATEYSEERLLINTNYLLPNETYPSYVYPGAWGIKTGYTTPADNCLVSGASSDTNALIGVVFGAPTTDSGDSSTNEAFPESAKLLNWGFQNYDDAIQYQNYLLTHPAETPNEETDNQQTITEQEPNGLDLSSEETDASYGETTSELEDSSLEVSSTENANYYTSVMDPDKEIHIGRSAEIASSISTSTAEQVSLSTLMQGPPFIIYLTIVSLLVITIFIVLLITFHRKK